VVVEVEDVGPAAAAATANAGAIIRLL